MNLTRIFTRSSLALAVLTLAACQTAPVQQRTATPTTAPAAAAPTAPAPVTPEVTQHAAEQGTKVAVFLADTAQQRGWLEIPIKIYAGQDTKLYLNPQPIIERIDLMGVQGGATNSGIGLLGLMLNDEAAHRLKEAGDSNPGKLLALVVGRTLMSARPYDESDGGGQLIFEVGTEANAMAAARAIAGVDETGAPLPPPAGMPPR